MRPTEQRPLPHGRGVLQVGVVEELEQHELEHDLVELQKGGHDAEVDVARFRLSEGVGHHPRDRLALHLSLGEDEVGEKR